MIEKEAYSWQDIADALDNDGVSVNEPMVIKLMNDIDCNDETYNHYGYLHCHPFGSAQEDGPGPLHPVGRYQLQGFKDSRS